MTFFIDNNLSPRIARGLAEFGEDVMHLQDRFEPDARDEAWLPLVGQEGWYLITRDEEIRRNPTEKAALKDHCVGTFFLGGKNLSRCKLIQQIVRCWPLIKESAAKTKRPFAFRVPPNGKKLVKITL